MATPHNAAAPGDVAPSVLLPGDPLRARYLAEHFLEGAREITAVRNMLGYTGSYRGVPVTVMGSGMGGPSAGIYAHELFSFYAVRRIIRIGTAGGLQPDLAVGDLVLALTASTDSNYAYQFSLPGTYAPAADWELLELAVRAARERALPFRAGSVFSSDHFSSYNALGPEKSWQPWAAMGCLAQDMETYALYCVAARSGRAALSVLTHTDSCVTAEGLPEKRRMTALHGMFEVALETVRAADRPASADGRRDGGPAGSGSER